MDKIIDILELFIDDLYIDTGKNIKPDFIKNILPKLEVTNKQLDSYYYDKMLKVIENNLFHNDENINKILDGIVARYFLVKGLKKLNTKNTHIMTFDKLAYKTFVNSQIYKNIYKIITDDLKNIVFFTNKYVLSWMKRKHFSKEQISEVKRLFNSEKIPYDSEKIPSEKDVPSFSINFGSVIEKHLQIKYKCEKIYFYFQDNDSFHDEKDNELHRNEYRHNSELIVPLIELLKIEYPRKTKRNNEIYIRLKRTISPKSNCPLFDTIEKWEEKRRAEPKTIFALIYSFNNKNDKIIFQKIMKNKYIKLFFKAYKNKNMYKMKNIILVNAPASPNKR